jgi:hypothetical protein
MTEAGRPLARAIRSLLVAADQRCPAIIGRAHILHHAHCADAERILAELKREAADLFAAIADLESAVQASRRHGRAGDPAALARRGAPCPGHPDYQSACPPHRDAGTRLHKAGHDGEEISL